MKLCLKIFIPLATAFLLFSCKKDHSVLGVDVQPAVDELHANYEGGLKVTAHTIAYDSIASFNDRYKFIGSNDDPYFGKTNIGLYLNANISKTDLSFGTSTLTSAEIILAIEESEFQFAGDYSAILTFSIYPLYAQMKPKDLYYTTRQGVHNPAKLPTTHTGGITKKNGRYFLKINFDSIYADAMMHDVTNLTNNDVFQAKYKGFYIETNIAGSGPGVIFRVNLDNDTSGLYFHYKDTIDNTFKFTFSGSASSKYNALKYIPTQSLNSQLQGDTALGATNLFLKGMGHTRLKVQIPFLQNYSDSFQVAVNRAEVVFYVDPLQSTGWYPPPYQLCLLAIDSLGRESFVLDQLNGTDYGRYGGVYDDANKRYVFNIPRHAQAIFRGTKKNYGFYLVVATSDVSLKTVYNGSTKELLSLRRDNYIERVIFAGSNNTSLRPRFNLNYIKFKND